MLEVTQKPDHGFGSGSSTMPFVRASPDAETSCGRGRVVRAPRWMWTSAGWENVPIRFFWRG